MAVEPKSVTIKANKRKYKSEPAWTAFDREMIACARDGRDIEIYFDPEEAFEASHHHTVKVLVVDRYFFKVQEGQNDPIWVAKNCIAGVIPK